MVAPERVPLRPFDGVVLTLEMVLKYGLNGGEPVLGTWVAILHGWIYVVYLVTVMDLWSTMRWGLGRMAALVVAGVVLSRTALGRRLLVLGDNADVARYSGVHVDRVHPGRAQDGGAPDDAEDPPPA